MSDRGLVDFDDLIAATMAIEHDPRAAKGVGDDAVGAGLGIAPLDREHALGMREIPGFAAVALLEAGEHQLSAHRAVAEQGPFFDRFQQSFLHGV